MKTASKKYRSTLTGVAMATVLVVVVSAQAQVPVPSFSKVFVPDTIGPGSVSMLQFDIVNQTALPVTDVAFTDTLPSGMTIATPASAFTDCTDAVLSAPSGGTTISLSGARLGVSSSCIVTVNVTSTITGLNVSGDLTSSAGNSGSTSATLTVDPGRPGFSKEFAPATIPVSGVSTLTLTVDNTAPGATNVFGLNFVDYLPPGMVIAAPANAATDCENSALPASLTAVSGTNLIQLFAQGLAPSYPTLTAGSTCTVAVDVTTDSTGTFVNTTGPLVSGSSSIPSGIATASLDVPVENLGKSFTDDPVPPGGTVTLEFTVNNLDRNDPATSISFSDDLGSVVAGLAPAGPLPATPCGAGSSLAFATGTLSLTGGSLPVSGSCTFSVPLAVPGSALSGVYTNTTSAISMNVGGSPVVGNTATDNLIVSNAPVLTKQFTNDPVGGGGSAILEFTITNSSSTAAATAIGFEDSFFVGLPTASAIPSPGFCGAGSTATFTPLSNPPGSSVTPARLTVAGANLGPGASCTFDITLDVALGVPSGIYPNATTPITATIGGEAVVGLPAIDTLNVVGGPRLLKEFTDDPAQPGGTTTLEFTLTHDPNAPADATNIAFTDDLNASLSGLAGVGLPATGVCGTGSQISGTTSLSFTGGTLAPGASCTFNVTLQIPGGATSGSYTNTTSDVTATVGGVSVTEYPATDDLMIAGLVLTKEFTDDPAFPGGPVTLRFTIENISTTSTATAIFFQDDLDNVISGLSASGLPLIDPCGAGSSLSGSSGDTFLSFIGGTLAPGASCSFDAVLLVPIGAASDVYPNATTLFSATIGSTTIPFPNAADFLVVSSDRLAITKSFTDDPVAPGGTATLEFTLTNFDPVNSVSAITFTDDLNAVLSGLAATGLPLANVCGAGSQIAGTNVLSLTGGNLAAGGSCTFSVTVQVPAAAPAGAYTNVTSQVSGTVTGLPVTGDPASDDLVIASGQSLSITKSFTDDPVLPGDTANLEFTITNLDGASNATAISFTDDLDAALSGLAATGLPLNNVCGLGSQISGAGILSLTGGGLTAGGSCTFSVSLQVPASAPAGAHTNVTSQVTGEIATLPVTGGPATDDLVIASGQSLSVAKSFTDDPVLPGDTANLEFTITNLDGASNATAISFTDDLGAALSGLAATGLPLNDVCGLGSRISGAGLVSLTGGVLPAGGSCTFTISLQVPANAPAGVHTNVTSQVTGDIAGIPAIGSPATDDLQVNRFTFSKAFGGPVPAGETATLTFIIENFDVTSGVTDISFTDDLDAVVPGMMAVGLPTSDVCGAGSALSGTSLLTLTGGNLPAGGSCTFAVDVLIPSTTTPGTYLNTTSDLFELGSPASEPAAADIVVEPALSGVEIPVTTPFGTVMLITLIALAALWRLRWRV